MVSRFYNGSNLLMKLARDTFAVLLELFHSPIGFSRSKLARLPLEAQPDSLKFLIRDSHS